MNNKGQSSIIYIIFLIIVLFGLYGLLSIMFTDSSIYCITNDYDDAFEEYRPYEGKDYGQIQCIKCYVEGCETSSIDVQLKKFPFMRYVEMKK